MQKYILSLIILCFQVQAFSQKLSFSVVFDPQMAWMKSDSKAMERDGTRFGYNVGLVLDRYFAENYAFSTGASIWQTGGQLMLVDSTGFQDPFWLDTLGSGTSVDYSLQYITVPISLKLKSNQIGYNTLFAHLGLNAHMNVRALAGIPEMDITDEDIRNEIRFLTVSYFIGGGLEYSLGGNTALMAGIYYTNGFLDIRKKEEYKVYLGNVALRLGIKF